MESFLNKLLFKKTKKGKRKTVRFVKGKGDSIACLGTPTRKSWEKNQNFWAFSSVFCLFHHGSCERG